MRRAHGPSWSTGSPTMPRCSRAGAPRGRLRGAAAARAPHRRPRRSDTTADASGRALKPGESAAAGRLGAERSELEPRGAARAVARDELERREIRGRAAAGLATRSSAEPALRARGGADRVLGASAGARAAHAELRRIEEERRGGAGGLRAPPGRPLRAGRARPRGSSTPGATSPSGPRQGRSATVAGWSKARERHRAAVAEPRRCVPRRRRRPWTSRARLEPPRGCAARAAARRRAGRTSRCRCAEPRRPPARRRAPRP